MDEIDRKIAIAVQQDGAAGLSDLAKVSGLSVSATAERVKRLEERGVIRGWHAALDPAEVGCPLLAFLRVAMRPGKEEIAFRRAIRKLDSVLECHQLTGEWSYLVKLRVADIRALDTILAEEIRPLAGIERLAVEVAMASVKETALLPVAHQPEEET
ncbi:Lrp/AsnC family transcriptional regulator [Roseococcus sp. SYP-B2431]|uniref:Lrp/AsnC family transcriptional regulator n=1 Tax=Roseococcus sp. SYP-B2431 TaxID=2496640 RepID=UPI00103D3906|nr:Lrp/AsnC family transcriptional regulator [Roseococcus sp. SYP-B2431]TCH96551.1 Lrp/AsnC family transcriptional regulator [Roseococcus sp. SYP-B2431]